MKKHEKPLGPRSLDVLAELAHEEIQKHLHRKHRGALPEEQNTQQLAKDISGKPLFLEIGEFINLRLGMTIFVVNISMADTNVSVLTHVEKYLLKKKRHGRPEDAGEMPTLKFPSGGPRPKRVRLFDEVSADPFCAVARSFHSITGHPDLATKMLGAT